MLKYMPVTHNTFVIQRTYRVSPARLFRAFSDPAQKRQWFAESDRHTVEDFALDFRVDGSERATYRFNETSPFPGLELTNLSTWHEIVEDSRIVFTSVMAMAGHRISVTLATIELTASAALETTLTFTHQAVFFENSDGPQIREHGWRSLFDRLAANL